ncbi:MAG: hypothetical protein IKU94_02705 [Bacteroidaceae bacterium]|nr:hypothetical protein [Bacteroidaceae bacterium]
MPSPAWRIEEFLKGVFDAASDWGATLLTETGNAPITLTNAVACAIHSLTQTGLCTQASTPTPSAPVDIYCNNGALKARRPSGLPLGYQKVEYIQATSGQYIDTGFVIPDLTNEYILHYRITIDGYTGNPGTSNVLGYMGQNGGLMMTLTRDSGLGTASSGVPFVANHIYDVTNARYNDATRDLTIDDTNFTVSAQTTVNDDRPFGVFKLSPFATTFHSFYGKFYGLQAYKNGTLIKDLVPCRRLSDSVVGVYDMVNNQFLTNAGTGAFTAGSDVPDSAYIYADGTAEVLTVTDADSNTQTASLVDLLSVGDYADTQEIISGTVKRNCGVWVLTGEENWSTASTNTDVYYINQTYLPDDYGVVNRFTPICSHLEGIISTQSITAMAANTIKTNNSSKIVYVCVGQTYTAAEWKAFLAAQYAAGTPVIVIYQLAEATTESVAGQSLSTAAGTNVVSVTAEVSPVALTCEYYGSGS